MENEEEKVESQYQFSQPWRIFIFEAFLFCLTLFLGVLTAFRVNKISTIQKIALPKISFWQFTFNFILATLFLLFVIYCVRFKKRKRSLFKALFAIAVFFGCLLFIESWIGEPVPLILTTLLVFWWLKKPSVLNQDILIIFGIAGVGSVLGLSLEPKIIIWILVIFSLYDFIAVYLTKHMIKMAKEMIEEGAILALIIPPNISNFRENLESVQPGGRFLILGGGDIAFPLLFSVSLISTGILNSIIVATFSLVGLFVGFYFFTRQKDRQPIPALPPIGLFSIIGYLITKLI